MKASMFDRTLRARGQAGAGHDPAAWTSRFCATRTRLQLNKTAAEIAQAAQVHAATDITGFGLSGTTLSCSVSCLQGWDI